MIDARLRKNLDISLVMLTVAVGLVGLVTIYSVTRDTPSHLYLKQFVIFLIGICLMGAAASADYTRIVRHIRPIYVINLLLLILVFRAHGAKGAQRWFTIGTFQLQPSELAKLAMIACLAVYLVSRIERIQEPGVLLGSLAYIALPMALIARQPDLGTSLVLVAVWFGMTFIAGARWQHLLLVALAGCVLFAGMWRFDLIKDYQKDRLKIFLDSSIDPNGIGYQVRQSRIAVGSGQITGKGFGKGTQAHGRFIPENHTDFIFTVLGEEGGFLEGTLLLALYSGILYRGARTIAEAGDVLGRLLAAGIVSMFAFHIVVNIGMTLGIMPVTGVPLPLVSYGGSSLLLNLTAIGLLLGIGMRKHALVF